MSLGGTKVGLSVKRPCRKTYRACFVGNDGMRCRPGLQTRGTCQLQVTAAKTQLNMAEGCAKTRLPFVICSCVLFIAWLQACMHVCRNGCVSAL